MANSVNRNVVFIDATGDITLTRSPSFIYGLLVSPSASTGGTIQIRKDSSTGQVIIRVVLLDDQTKYVPFNIPIVVPTTINVSTLSTITSAQLYGIFE